MNREEIEMEAEEYCRCEKLRQEEDEYNFYCEVGWALAYIFRFMFKREWNI